MIKDIELTDTVSIDWKKKERTNDGGKRIVRDSDVDTYTSTRTGKAASRNSSRQLGGYRICTWIRVPWFSVISNECFFGSASLSRRCLIDEFAMLNSSCNNIFVLIECTPTRRKEMGERESERNGENGTIEAIKIYPIWYIAKFVTKCKFLAIWKTIRNCAIKFLTRDARMKVKFNWCYRDIKLE